MKKQASGREVKYVIGPRRPGDLGNVTAVADLSFKGKSLEKELGVFNSKKSFKFRKFDFC